MERTGPARAPHHDAGGRDRRGAKEHAEPRAQGPGRRAARAEPSVAGDGVALEGERSGGCQRADGGVGYEKPVDGAPARRNARRPPLAACAQPLGLRTERVPVSGRGHRREDTFATRTRAAQGASARVTVASGLDPAFAPAVAGRLDVTPSPLRCRPLPPTSDRAFSSSTTRSSFGTSWPISSAWRGTSFGPRRTAPRLSRSSTTLTTTSSSAI